MNGLLDPDIVKCLVGVIDLKSGNCVHAIAGNRANYEPVRFVSGDSRRLADHYWQLGLRKLYVADLDALAGGKVQTDCIGRLVQDHAWDLVLLDAGWIVDAGCRRETFLKDLPHKVMLIAATESAPSPNRLHELVQLCSAERTMIGMDYRDGVFKSQSGTESDWIAASERLAISGAVVLDVATVGTETTNVDQVSRFRSTSRLDILVSGGGIRTAEDVRAFQEVGCDHCLVATALMP